MEPLISVNITTYNRAHLLPRAIDSVVAQSYPMMEIVVVDDCSNDNTIAILEEYQKKDSRIKFIRHETNKGNARARNTALQNSKGSFISFLDDDDEWIDKDKLKKQVELFGKIEGNIAIICTNVVLVAEDGTRRNKIINRPNSLVKHILAKNGIIYSPTVMVKSNIFKKVGFFDEKLSRGIDSEFYRTCIVKHGFDVYFMPEITTAIHEYGRDRITLVADWNAANKSLIANCHIFRKYKYAFISNPFLALKRLRNLINQYRYVFKNKIYK